MRPVVIEGNGGRIRSHSFLVQKGSSCRRRIVGMGITYSKSKSCSITSSHCCFHCKLYSVIIVFHYLGKLSAITGSSWSCSSFNNMIRWILNELRLRLRRRRRSRRIIGIWSRDRFRWSGKAVAGFRAITVTVTVVTVTVTIPTICVRFIVVSNLVQVKRWSRRRSW